MKKLLMLLIVMAGITVVSAQDSLQHTKNDKVAQRKAARELEKSTPWKIQYVVGINVSGETPIAGSGKGAQGAKLSASPGLSFEVRLTRHSGLELGVNYRRASYDGHQMMEVTPSMQKYISIPLLYKFSSRILNFSAGFNYDIMLADSYNGVQQDERHSLGVMLKLTKDIRLCKGLLIEPYVLANPMLTKPGVWLGFGVGLKYRF